MTTTMTTRVANTPPVTRLLPKGGRVFDFKNGSLPAGVGLVRASAGYRTRADGVLEAAVSDLARFDFTSSSTMRGLHLEGAATNQLLRSEDLGNVYWSKVRCTVVTETAAAPDGMMTADKIVEDTGTLGHYFQRVGGSLVAGETYTLSVYAKAVERSVVQLVFGSGTHGTTAYANFNLTTGALGTVGAGMGARISPAGNGYYRCELTGLVATSGTSISTVAMVPDATAGRIPDYTGNGSSGLLVWGLQLEKNTFATSYIPTVAATATRAADVVQVASVAALGMNPQEGTVLVEATFDGLTGAAQRLLELYGDANNRFYVGLEASGSLAGAATTSGTQDVALTGPAVSAGTVYKLALRYRRNDWAMCVNGGTVAVDTSGLVPAVKTLAVGGSVYAGVPLHGYVRRIEYWPLALTDNELKRVTA